MRLFLSFRLDRTAAVSSPCDCRWGKERAKWNNQMSRGMATLRKWLLQSVCLVVLWSLLVEADPRCGKTDNEDDCTVPQQPND